MKLTTTCLVDEQNMETKTKSDDKDQHNEGSSCNGAQNTLEHEYEDAKVGNGREEAEEVEPGGSEKERPHRPFPALRETVSLTNNYLCRRTAFRCIFNFNDPNKIIKNQHKRCNEDSPVYQITQVKIATFHPDHL